MEFGAKWYFAIHTDHVIEARRPDLVILDKKHRICKIIELTVSRYNGMAKKEKEKRGNYQRLTREMMWKVNVTMIVTIIGALGTIPKNLGKSLKDVDITTKVGQLIR